MERESFGDEQVAKALKDGFVSVKVDREERPDVDHLYMSCCLSLNGHGGWPLSIFCTPERKPFYAGTYYPKRDFLSLLENIGKLWDEDRSRLIDNANKIAVHLHDVKLPRAIPGNTLERAAKTLLRRFDKRYGGFLPAPKFPAPHNITFLFRYGVAMGDTSAYHAAFTTLSAMLRGGLHDHVGGGFFRYSTDAKWRTPHFEKMCYDQALIMTALTEASELSGGSYNLAVRELFDFMMEDLWRKDGGFHTAWDADSEGDEGRYYLWTFEQVKEAIGDDAERFCKLYAVEERAKHGSNLRLSKAMGEDDLGFAAKCLAALKAARAKRVPPFRDEKLLLTNNALMTAALAKAGGALKEPEYTFVAGNTLRFMESTFVKEGRLLEARGRGEGGSPATLDGYAYFIWALIEMYGATFDPRYLKSAIEWNEKLLRLFDDGRGGLYFAGSDVLDLPVRQHNAFDGSVPSGVSVQAMNLLRLARICAEPEWGTRAQRLMENVSNEVNSVPDGYTALLSAYMFHSCPGADVVLTSGDNLDAMTKALKGYRPFMCVAVCGEGYEMMASIAPFTRAMKEKSSAYVCVGNACQPPVDTPDKLAALIGPAGHGY